jgi:hypothetical protein
MDYLIGNSGGLFGAICVQLDPYRRAHDSPVMVKNASPSPMQGSIAENDETGKRRQALIRRASASASGKYPSRSFP